MRVFKNFVLRRKLFALFLGIVLLGTLFVPFVEQRASDELVVEDDQPDSSSGNLVDPNPIRNAIPSALYRTVRLTNNSFDDMYPQIDEGQVTWQGYDGSDWEIFLYDGTSITQLTNNSYNDLVPQINGGMVTWQGQEGPDWEIFLYNGSSTVKLTNNTYDDITPQIDEGQVTWEAHLPNNYAAIFFYNGTSIVQLTSSFQNCVTPQIDSGQIVWVRDNGAGGREIFFYDGSSTIQLTDFPFRINNEVQIDAGQVTWHGGFQLTVFEIYLYDGASTTQLTDSGSYSNGQHKPQIDGGQVVWYGWDGNSNEIFLYDGSSTTQLTDMSWSSINPQIDAGHVTWQKDVTQYGTNWEIFFYNGESLIQISNNPYDDEFPQIDGDQIAWQGHDGVDTEIFLYLAADIPDPPANPIVQQGILYNYLSWDAPPDSGAGIHYNIYRGEVENGSKTIIGYSTSTSYNDTAVIGNTMYYYEVTAENIVGESLPSVEVSGMPRDAPFLEWRSPAENTEVVLPIGDAIFEFRYDWGEIDDVELVINGTSFGNVWGVNTTILSPYTADIDGRVESVLIGYMGGIPLVSASRNFTFAKLTVEVMEQMDSGSKYLGQQLYSILHDPNGDGSYSGFKEQEGLSIGVGASLALSLETEKKWGIEVGIPGIGDVGAEYSTKLEKKISTQFDYRYEIKTTVGLTSNTQGTDSDYMGPGFGDTYWGEAWECHWLIQAYYREYFNGSKQYEAPVLRYVVTRSSEVLLSDYNAPEEWRAMNPVHNNWANVDWIDSKSVDGGLEYSWTQEVSHSMKTHTEIEIKFSASVAADLSPFTDGGASITFGVDFQTYFEAEWKNTYTTSYSIYDDDSDDHIAFDYGIDQIFGTPIFRPVPIACKTSFPLERNTMDYLPPIIEFPTIKYDTSLDGVAPCKDDQPTIIVDVFDEGGIQLALIRYSINGGTNWDSVNLTEQSANPGTWQGSIPAMNHGMTIQWYIQVWDLEGSNSTRMNPNGLPYRYTVVNRAPSIEILSPLGAESYLDTLRISWSASDLDDDELTYTLSYNIANTGWQLLASGVSGTYYDWDISNLPYCGTVLVKVVADDGFGGSTFDECDYVFTIGTPPEGDGDGGGPFVGLLLVGGAALVGVVVVVGVYLSRRSPIIIE